MYIRAELRIVIYIKTSYRMSYLIIAKRHQMIMVVIDEP